MKYSNLKEKLSHEKGYTYEEIDTFISRVLKNEAKVSDELSIALSRCINGIDGIVNDLYNSIVNESEK